jgi:ribosomal protein S18 acetylase RimI-like enzyme
MQLAVLTGIEGTMEPAMSNPAIRLMPFEQNYVSETLAIWNDIVLEGLTFPWIEPFTEEQLLEKLKSEDTVYVAVDESDTVLGMFHVHPNNEGRCAHIANCGYMVSKASRGQGIGRLLVQGSLQAAQAAGYRGMQFNAVVSTNTVALELYRTEGFTIIGTVPGGFLLPSGDLVDMHILFRALEQA